ncbi:hypothetical protein, conserved [Eimeria tenella]|uniref:Uncharacterized protein n=1 Tax=Eimeria tenella TaxID=5802 RepID=U6L5Q2_EIMTE|nr:hypothetical protein, conserved [Eimeria tenella]CDJ43125.1 hypothetical protein, conserved [Eimeria tenella]|eukprot:XP_013233875.1 hypothetical protein, conserved [Eimeria tenella]
MQALNVGVGENEPVFTVLFENEKANSAALQQYADKIVSSGVQSRRGLVHKSSRGRSGAAFLASAAALVVLIFLCTRGQKRWDQLAAYGRQLSEDDDSRPVAKRSWCSDSGGEADISSDDDTTEMPPMLEPLAKRARAEAESDGSRELSNVDAGVQQAARPSSKGAIGSTGATARRRLRRRVRRRPSASKSKDGQWSAYELQAAAGLLKLWPASSSIAESPGAPQLCCPESRTSLPVRLSTRELQAVSALHQLGELTGSEGATGEKHDEQVELEDEPQPSTSAAAQGVEVDEQQRLLDSVVQDLLSTVTPSSAGGSTSAGQEDPTTHPFCRLPSVDRSEIVRRFDPDRVFLPPQVTDKPFRQFLIAHDLLVKPRLSPKELLYLTRAAENLAAYAVSFQNFSIRDLHANVAARHLGLRFLVFDILVSTLELLDQKPEGAWWKRLTAAVPHDYPPSPILHSLTATRLFNLVLCHMLTTSLETLKSGSRPACSRILGLKRFLFCFKQSPPRFRTASFDAWRNDDKGFSEGFKGPP